MLKKIIHFGTICALFSIIVSCSSSKKVVKTEDKPFDEIGTFLQSLVDTAGIPGIAIAITNGQDIVYSKGFGVINVETKGKLEPYHTFHIASISKTYTATAVMQLYENGKIDIDKPLILTCHILNSKTTAIKTLPLNKCLITLRECLMLMIMSGKKLSPMKEQQSDTPAV